MKIIRIILFTALAVCGLTANMVAQAYCRKPVQTPEGAYEYATICDPQCSSIGTDDYDAARACNECRSGAAAAAKAAWDTYYSCVKAERLDGLEESDRVEDKVRY